MNPETEPEKETQDSVRKDTRPRIHMTDWLWRLRRKNSPWLDPE